MPKGEFMSSDEVEENAKMVIKKKKIVTLQYLTTLLNCSIRTVRRKLKQWNVLSSYNNNGRYYTLPGIPKFNTNGIWRYQDAYFSRFGNLTQTVTHLVHHSPRGLSVNELCEILGIAAGSFRTFFDTITAIKRQKMVTRVIYVSADDAVSAVQINERSKTEASIPEGLPRDTESIIILVDRIRFPDSSLEGCAARVRKIHPSISITSIHRLLTHHGLLKKTAGMRY